MSAPRRHVDRVPSPNTGSVLIVAGLEFIKTSPSPSSRSLLHACVPE